MKNGDWKTIKVLNSSENLNLHNKTFSNRSWCGTHSLTEVLHLHLHGGATGAEEDDLRVYIKTGGSDGGHACYLGAVVAGREPGYLLPRRVENPLVGAAPVTGWALDPLQFPPLLGAGELGTSFVEDVPLLSLDISIKKSYSHCC